MIETIASVFILGFLMITLGRVSMVELNNQDSVDAQYSVLAADAMMSDIYRDFHSALEYSFVESSEGQKILTFVMPDGDANSYSLDPTVPGMCKNGMFQFEATKFEVLGTQASMTVSIKIPGERLLDFTIYR